MSGETEGSLDGWEEGPTENDLVHFGGLDELHELHSPDDSAAEQAGAGVLLFK